MNYTEQTLSFSCAGETLCGVLAEPEELTQTAVIVVVGGPQYRAGSHRQFVLLARHLAAGGYPTLRFDVRGMGDSQGAPRNFEQLNEDIGAAIDAVQQRLPAVSRVVLWGLCDGASAALLYCHETGDARVRGLCLANPWVRSEASLARTQVKHYYADRLRQRAFWVKLLSGKVALGAVSGLLRNVRAARGRAAGPGPEVARTPQTSYQQRMAAAWRDFDGDMLLLLSGRDYTAKEFSETAQTDAAWTGLLRLPHLNSRQLDDADHTFSGDTSRREAEGLTLEWLRAGFESTAGRTHPAAPHPMENGNET